MSSSTTPDKNNNPKSKESMTIDEENPSPSATTNPPLRILTKTPTRRRKGGLRKGRIDTKSNNSNNDYADNDKEMKGLLRILLIVAFFVAIEVIVVDSLFLGAQEIRSYNDVEFRMLSSLERHNDKKYVYLSDLVEAGWNRYARAGEVQKLLFPNSSTSQQQQQEKEDVVVVAGQAELAAAINAAAHEKRRTDGKRKDMTGVTSTTTTRWGEVQNILFPSTRSSTSTISLPSQQQQQEEDAVVAAGHGKREDVTGVTSTTARTTIKAAEETTRTTKHHKKLGAPTAAAFAEMLPPMDKSEA
mmetsp:Transcript_21597/g.32985  ORF Transcript_21597/g.32985 Transcript_21597/m.32985 type:complete len:301 (+) Transcript_21597:98-1000(+)|eukprot:CAMPEP_0117032206 /NCGR_PEP_ID=MMETSP0472-20121206/23096_1 /TAXON_ID=693140 ORGANISM="Tiarina fusus, Strain LIS" /NCGR_SAMPLE_ID=MMETSP0472 /ASSEMBLY_ACC=CAM_ASM_000603 /LENGTH=300 /DNA_ID=CAMNT_0004740763 /DNA_START=98 /DNA_END=1003 /DNA_ORIENTATION=-